MSARVLVIDIETSPSLGYVWSLWRQNVALNQLVEVGEVISFAWKWHGDRFTNFVSNYKDGHEGLVRKAHALLDEADVVVTWNGKAFDVPHLQREIILAGLTPPSPFKQIDLYLTARKQFKFVSNKLDHVAQQLGVGRKASTGGFDLWLRCMADDPKAWKTMERYNRRDVEITDRVYTVLKPWLVSAPHLGLYVDGDRPRCGKCGGDKVQRRGFAFTDLGKFRQYKCMDPKCGAWSRSGKREGGADLRPVAS